METVVPSICSRTTYNLATSPVILWITLYKKQSSFFEVYERINNMCSVQSDIIIKMNQWYSSCHDSPKKENYLAQSRDSPTFLKSGPGACLICE